MKRATTMFAWLAALLAGASLWAGPALAADVYFTNATIGLLEVRTTAWGSWMIIQLNDSSGNQMVKLCDAAGDKATIALSMGDPSAKAVLAVALTAKATGKTVTGWGIDQTQGNWCGIGNFAIFP